MSKGVLNNIIILLSSSGFQIVTRLTVIGILSRLLTPAEFGVIAIALSIIMFSQIFSEIGFSASVIQKEVLSENQIQSIFSLSVLISFFMGILMLLLSKPISVFFNEPILQYVISSLSAIFPIKGFSNISKALTMKEMKFSLIAYVELISYTIGYGTIAILLSLLGFGVWSLVIANLIVALIETIILYSLKPIKFNINIKIVEIKEMIYFGVWFSINKIASYFANQADYLVVGKVLGLETLGFYNKSYQLISMPSNYIGNVVDKVLFSSFSIYQKDILFLEKTYIKSFNLLSSLLIPLSAFMFFLAPEIIYLMLGPSWESVTIPFRILALFIVFRSTYKINDALIRSLGLVKDSAKRKIVYAFIVIVSSLIGSLFGIIGVAIGVSIAILINFLITTSLATKVMKVNVIYIFSIILIKIPISALYGVLLLQLLNYLRLNYNAILVFFISIIFTTFFFIGLFNIFPFIIFGKESNYVKNKLKYYAAYLLRR